ncbi:MULTISPECIES: putative quinol monooxygenase [Clavibacter]|uniref:Monooxygenase n=2 Tax=Clavibacter TaxID=1573 RepID=A0A399NIW8_9MICO|nr:MULTISPECIES: antibiotic biosynthesis monooxygenase family protein [Clavibacter]KDP90707.1 monooxygenase [Clavibacter cf. michiganensis LMG 26808]RII94070.1 monooxygenase [Clavibacter michiganensis]UKF26178.1 antibiotic biosynthesis monooxygenase [Clavibacter sp. A6099]
MSTTVHLEIQVDESRLADVADVLAETLQATRAFAGNEGLEVLVDDADPARMVVVEQWASTADHDAYVAWRATPEGTARLGEVLAAAPVTRVFSGRIALAL